MHLNDFLGVLRRQPFHPFRLHVTNGSSYEIRHPELVMVGRRDVILGIPAPGDSEPLADQWVMIDLPHITHVEKLATPAAPAQPN